MREPVAARVSIFPFRSGSALDSPCQRPDQTTEVEPATLGAAA
jgi:hypothetical protein